MILIFVSMVFVTIIKNFSYWFLKLKSLHYWNLWI